MKDIDRIEIKDPPLQELNKKRSCLWRTCFTGCGCIVFFLAVTIVFIWYATTPRVHKLKTVPEELTRAVPLYDTDSITNIRFTSGLDRRRAIARGAYIPKIALSPLLYLLDQNSTSSIGAAGQIMDWSTIRRALDSPVTDERDLYQIEWQDLPASAGFIESFYRAEFGKRKFELESTAESNGTKQFVFHKKNISGRLIFQPAEKETGTKYLSLTVLIPAPTEK